MMYFMILDFTRSFFALIYGLGYSCSSISLVTIIAKYGIHIEDRLAGDKHCWGTSMNKITEWTVSEWTDELEFNAIGAEDIGINTLCI